MPQGYNGKILHIHLDRMELEVETPSETFYRTYAGGSALGTYYLLKHSPVGAIRWVRKTPSFCHLAC